MTALNFPNSPAVRDLFGTSYQWDGEKWIVVNSQPIGSAEVVQFLARTSGLDATHVTAYSTLIDGLVADGVWSKFDVLYIFATQNATTAALNLVSATYNATVTGSPVFTADRGFIANGAGYINSNFNPSTASSPKFVRNSAHAGGWVAVSAGVGTTLNPFFGGNVGGNVTAIHAHYSGGGAYFYVNSGGGGGPTAVANAAGFYLGNRSAASALQGYKNASQIYTGADASVAPFNANIGFCAYLDPSVQYVERQLAAGFIGSSLTSGEALAFFNRLNAYMIAVGAPSAEAAVFLSRTTGLDATHTNAYIALINGLVSDGVWSKFDVLHIYATQDTTTAQLNLKSSSYPATLNGSPTFTADRGYTGVEGSSTVYINPSFTFTGSVATQNSSHMSGWSVTDSAQSNNSFMGAADASATIEQTLLQAHHLADGKIYGRMNSSVFPAGVANTTNQGHYVVTRSSSSTLDVAKNGTVVGSGLSSTSTTPSVAPIILGWKQGGTVKGAPNQLAMISIGSGLNGTEISNFYNRLRTYMTAVGVP